MHHLVSGIHFWVLLYSFPSSAQSYPSVSVVVEVDQVDLGRGKHPYQPLISLGRDTPGEHVLSHSRRETPAATGRSFGA